MKARKDTTESTREKHLFDWQGRTIEVRYEPASFAGHAHLQISARGCRPLPITETGYRSHFSPREDVEHYGGPVAYVRAWLDAASQTKAWRRAEAEGHQLSFF